MDNIKSIAEEKRNKAFQGFYFDEGVQTELDKLIRFLIGESDPDEATHANYNVLVTYEEGAEERREEFIQCMIKLLDDFDKNLAVFCTEDIFVNKIEQVKKARVAMISEIHETDSDNGFQELLKNTREIIKIVVASEKQAELRFTKEDTKLYYRTFISRMHLKPAGVEAVIVKFFHNLERENYSCTDGFRSEMEDYIRTIYETREERDHNAFLLDLSDRVFREYAFADVRTKRVFDEACVPKYAKKRNNGETKIEVANEKDKQERESVERSQIPFVREFYSCDSEEENVILLSVSTISALKMYKYENEDKTYRCTGISQLEPGTKNILYKLAKEGKKVNRIVMIESSATRKTHMEEVDPLFWDDSEFMKDKYWSAACFYKQRIRDYLKRSEKKNIVNGIMLSEEYSMPFPTDVCYTDEELDKLFYDIPSRTKDEPVQDEVRQESSLELFMDIIKGIKGQDKKTINLYIDTQGGARDANQQINAVMELLKNQNVTIKGRFAIPKFNPRNQEKVHVIEEVGNSYKAYELVSAMTEFKSYGRGHGLNLFFNQEQDKVTRKMVDIINLISGAIALCNMSLFENALNEMQILKNDIESESVQLESEIRMVFEDIISSYSELMFEERTAFDIVKWCVKHKYYQQAITIIESKMPQVLTKSRIFNFKEDRVITSNKGNKKTLAEICALKKEDWKPIENYLFEQWMYNNARPHEDKYFGVELKLDGTITENWTELYKQFKDVKDLKFWGELKGESYQYDYYARNAKNVNEKRIQILLMFSALSAVLKKARNTINHAQASISEQQVQDALEAYVSMGEELRKSGLLK